MKEDNDTLKIGLPHHLGAKAKTTWFGLSNDAMNATIV